MTATIHHGDALDILRGMPDSSVDSVVCDPPYGLSKEPDMVEVLRHWLDGDDYVHKGAGFMGKSWDSFVPGPSIWRECYRVLKPGGHLVAFAGSRTYDLMGVAIRIAGFEIRDGLQWAYGSGFPKSLDVGKAIDKAGGESPEAQSRVLREARMRAGLSREDVAASVGCTPSSILDWEVGGHMPSARYRAALADLLGYTADERVITGTCTDRRGDGTVVGLGHSGVQYGGPATPAAERWSGWGTALKPSVEPIVLARRPLEGTVAGNVLAWGTGGINVDACRVDGGARPLRGADYKDTNNSTYAGRMDGSLRGGSKALGDTTAGRWPSNFILSHASTPDGHDACEDGCVGGCPVRELDGQSGITKDGIAVARNGVAAGMYGPSNPVGTPDQGYGGEGGASRFFPTFRYQAKAGRAERPTYERDGGSDHATSIGGGLKVRECRVCRSRGKPAGGEHSDKPWPTCGHGDWMMVEQLRKGPNVVAHPTVKPLTLMAWLCRLVTPPGGTVLDPFAGSGTTGEAALLGGFAPVLIEREADYIPLIRARLNRATPQAPTPHRNPTPAPQAETLWDEEETA